MMCSLCQMSVEKIRAALLNVSLSHFKSVNLDVILVGKRLYFPTVREGLLKKDMIQYVYFSALHTKHILTCTEISTVCAHHYRI